MKPREKLRQFGIRSLSDDDLIALILGHGTKKENIFQCARRILEKFNQDELMNIHNIDEFMERFQLGYAQSIQLIATFEIGKRFFRTRKENLYFRTAEQVYLYVRNMAELEKEHVRGMYLDSRYKLIHEETLCIGSLNNIALIPRDIFKPAMEHNAYAFILLHNHPSGDPTPSPEDILTTQQIQKAAEIIQIPLLDHIIVGKESYKSVLRH